MVPQYSKPIALFERFPLLFTIADYRTAWLLRNRRCLGRLQSTPKSPKFKWGFFFVSPWTRLRRIIRWIGWRTPMHHLGRRKLSKKSKSTTKFNAVPCVYHHWSCSYERDAISCVIGIPSSTFKSDIGFLLWHSISASNQSVYSHFCNPRSLIRIQGPQKFGEWSRVNDAMPSWL